MVMHKNTIRMAAVLSCSLVAFSLISAFTLSSIHVSAEDIVDDIAITVPISCTMSGTGTDSHTATINPGTYNSSIGLTTITAFCNDNEGFSIYAIGYTNTEDGNNVLTDSNLTSASDIATSTATSGNNSAWAMKLTAPVSPTPTYPITIQSDTEGSFSSFHTVPDDYTLVAKRTAGTDIGTNAEGSTLTTTYQAYISQTQPAGTYTGKVKYTMVHPHSVDENMMKNSVTVVFDGDGLTFPDGRSTNTVRYTRVHDSGPYAYVSDTVSGISKTPNVNNDGTPNGSIVTNDSYSDSVTISGADKLKVVLRYDFDPSTANSSNANAYVNVYDNDYSLYSEYYGNGTDTIIAEGDTVNFHYASWGDIDENHDYGYYAEVYAVYDDEQPNTTGETIPSNSYSILPISGAYAETTEWHDKWIATTDGYEYIFAPDQYCESDWCLEDNTARGSLFNYIRENYDSLKGTTLNVKAYNPVTFDEVYTAANKTKTNGYFVAQDLNASMCAEVSKGEVGTVIDVRDNNTYNIAKLRNGWCWMKNDLKLDPTDTNVAANLSATNTNASNDAIYNYLHGGNPNNVDGWTSVAVVEDGDNQSFTAPKIDKSGQSETVGIKYNYCAISVGTFCYENSGNVYTTHISNSLCPANWQIPPNQNSSILDANLGITATGSVYYWTADKRLNSTAHVYQIRTFGYYNEYQLYFDIINYGSRDGRNLARCIIIPSN